MANLFDGIIFDIDGTVARGRQALPGVAETLAELRRRHIRYAFFTNDNSSTIDDWVKKLAGMGIEARSEEVMTSALIAAQATAQLYTGKRILAVGDAGLIEALQARKLDLLKYDEAEQADVVVMGKDPDFNQERLKIVCRAIWNGAEFLATNYDPKVPTADGFIPATGPMVKAVAYATGREPLVTGKPSPWSGKMAVSILDVEPERAAFVGDQLATDIKTGNEAGLTTILVLTGTASRADAEAAPEDVKPDVILPDVNQLIPWMNGAQ